MHYKILLNIITFSQLELNLPTGFTNSSFYVAIVGIHTTVVHCNLAQKIMTSPGVAGKLGETLCHL